MISIIAAIGKNNELGKNNKLLWSLPANMAHFKKLTTGVLWVKKLLNIGDLFQIEKHSSLFR